MKLADLGSGGAEAEYSYLAWRDIFSTGHEKQKGKWVLVSYFFRKRTIASFMIQYLCHKECDFFIQLQYDPKTLGTIQSLR